jgi:hypothetical protein
MAVGLADLDPVLDQQFQGDIRFKGAIKADGCNGEAMRQPVEAKVPDVLPIRGRQGVGSAELRTDHKAEVLRELATELLGGYHWAIQHNVGADPQVNVLGPKT